jgi:hypothetical protein
MNTVVVRHLLDAMDALQKARAENIRGFTEDHIVASTVDLQRAMHSEIGFVNDDVEVVPAEEPVVAPITPYVSAYPTVFEEIPF